MARNPRFQRRPPFRQSKPMVLVATEGKETEPIYFEGLKKRFRDVVTVLVSAGKVGQSNPQRVLRRLHEEMAKRAAWSKRDQAWLVPAGGAAIPTRESGHGLFSAAEDRLPTLSSPRAVVGATAD